MLASAGAVELGPGLWRWTAYYPDWKADVGCLAYSDGREFVLIDPLAPHGRTAASRFWRALDDEVRERGTTVNVLLTVRWHERHAPRVVERYARSQGGAKLWAPAGAVPYLSGQPDVPFEPGDRLPAGIVAHDALRVDEVVLWLPRPRALVAGDVLLGGKRKPLRVCPQGWLPRGVRRAEVAAALAPLVDIPLELVVPAHGEPIRSDARAVLEQALADVR
jgi:glyoxylase-like metal-dependent hydrolase (beta-lactamase superfamily II)